MRDGGSSVASGRLGQPCLLLAHLDVAVVDGDDLASRIHDFRGVDRIVPDRRAERSGAPLGDRPRKASPVAVPALSVLAYPHNREDFGHEQ